MRGALRKNWRWRRSGGGEGAFRVRDDARFSYGSVGAGDVVLVGEYSALNQRRVGRPPARQVDDDGASSRDRVARGQRNDRSRVRVHDIGLRLNRTA